jgi:hypothetical protein
MPVPSATLLQQDGLLERLTLIDRCLVSLHTEALAIQELRSSLFASAFGTT